MKRKQRNKRKQTKKRHNKYKEEPAHENEEFKDTFKINQALSNQDYALLREIGREKGFKSDAIRRRVWPFLLLCTDLDVDKATEGSLKVPHKDEEQVKLDVLRSFNQYPKHIDEGEKKKLENQLSHVIQHVLRSYPSLHYYQGFHDICSIFILLFGEKYATQLMIPVALFYLRDVMFVTMEPVLKQLTILDTLIRLEDTELYDFIKEADVLPYYCLSWVITWCSHDLDDVSKITRIFDLFLCSNPFMPIYFSAAVVISRRKQVLALPCDTSIIHSTLTKLPKDLDVNQICQKACELEQKYPVYKIQCESGVALDIESSVNRFEKDWIPIETIDQLNDTIQHEIIPILKNTEHREPIELESSVVQEENTLLERLKHNRKDAALYTLVTLGAGVGLLAIFMSNSDLVRDWLFTGV